MPDGEARRILTTKISRIRKPCKLVCAPVKPLGAGRRGSTQVAGLIRVLLGDSKSAACWGLPVAVSDYDVDVNYVDVSYVDSLRFGSVT